MPNAKEIRATLLVIITFLVRPSIFLLIGLGGGYYMGWSDAFRDSDTLGDKVARVVYRVHPDSLSQGIRQRASVLRDTIQQRTGAEIPPN